MGRMSTAHAINGERRQGAHRLRLLSAVALALALVTWAQPAPAATKTFIALLNAGQEVPPTTSDAIGVAHVTFDTKTKMLCYSVTYLGLTNGEGDELQAHFHGPAPAGQNAAVVFNVSPDPSPLGSPKTGCVGPLDKTQKGDLQKGLLYLNIHSAMYPPGEIRGQVLPVKGAK